MKVPLSWLKEYVDITVPVDELAHRLTMAGTEVGEVAGIGDWTNCQVGLVTKVEPHPNADRLTLCTVDTGSEQAKVVCGAPNVAEGQKIAYAKVGAELFNSHSGKREELKAATIRGVVSEGMICSELELGMGDDHTGILVLPQEAPLGTSLSEYLGDYVLDLEVTPNRPDCLSVLGVAHEVAALTGGTVREPDGRYPEGDQPIESLASVEVADPDLCRRYTASLISGVKVGPSPQWLQDRLQKAGMRPINNVVDITNFVMLEYNQPLHAFDFDTVKEGKVIVRRARPGEVLTTLDGVERKLTQDMLVIADARDAVGLGGVIGGVNSEMTEATTAVLLESANFDPINNRRTAQALRLSTEASTRFEKGLRLELAPIALRRATQLIADITGGVVAKGTIDVFPDRDRYTPPTVTLTMARLRKVLGVDLPIGRVEQTLASLGFACERLAESAIKVLVPYWRSDIAIEDDLVEEVARVVGYDGIPTTMLSTPIPHHGLQPLLEIKDRVRDLLAAYGLQEVINYPVTSLEDLGKVKAQGEGVAALKLANPMSAQQEYMRTNLLGGLLSNLAANQLRDAGPVAIFESGRIYLPREGDLPEEREMMAGVMAGPLGESHWLSAPGERGYYDAKGVVDSLLEALGIVAAYTPGDHPALHPARSALVRAEAENLGTVGEVHPSVAEGFGVAGPVAVFELDMESLLSAVPEQERHYQPFSRFPSATRDLSIVLDDTVASVKVQEIIQRNRLVTAAQLFDLYSGDNIPQGKRSQAYHIQFQSTERTLTSEEVNRAFDALVAQLQGELGAELRD